MSADLTEVSGISTVTGPADSIDAWSAVLDSLESAIDDAVAGDLPDGDPTDTDLDDAALEQAAMLGSWTPPVALGPIPAALVERARSISEHQQSAVAHLARELRTLRQHRSVLGSVQTATAPRQTSVYLDVTG